ncbi:MAG: PPC domain-containing protein [Planctomycetaceae bacterium]|nr:PPC domain-containing protein [Planctomycetaceae bacterium]
MNLSSLNAIFRSLFQAYSQKRRRKPVCYTPNPTEHLEERVLLAADLNDQLREARWMGDIGTNRAVTGFSISEATDVDMFSFRVQSGQRIGIDIDRAGGSLDSYIRVFDANGRQVAFNDDGAAPGESFSYESYLEHTFSRGGVYFVGVSGYGNSTYNPIDGTGDRNGSTGRFTIRINQVDDNDQLREARWMGFLTQTRTATGFSIDNPYDVDMFSFRVNAGQRIAFDIDRPSGNLDSVIRIFDVYGRQVAFNDDGAAPGESASLESYLEHTFTTGGAYFIGVSGYGNSTYSAAYGGGDRVGRTGNFSLRISPLGSSTSNDPNDQLREARWMGDINTTRQATGFTIDVPTDVDMFSFRVQAGQRVAFDIDRPNGSLDSVIRVFDLYGNVVAMNDDGAAPGESASYESYLEHTFSTGGFYFIGVSGYGNSNYSPITGFGDTNGSTGAFTLTISQVVNTPPPPGGSRVLYMNFEGASISNSDLTTWAGSDWQSSVTGYLDPEGDGIRVSQFLGGQTDRNQIIDGIMARVQADLTPYGITVQRVYGMGAVGTGATTLFFGNHNMAGIPHVASDIDFNNDNGTDIGFVLEEDWGSTTATITALADVALHEAGHTYGLFHVQVVQNGTIFNESMGLRYSTNSSEWVRDTAFLDRSFEEYLNHSGIPGTQYQNAHQTMLQNFGLAPSANRTAEPQLSGTALRDIFLADAVRHGHGHDDHDHDHEDHAQDDHDHEDHDDDLHDQVYAVVGQDSSSVSRTGGFFATNDAEDRILV